MRGEASCGRLEASRTGGLISQTRRLLREGIYEQAVEGNVSRVRAFLNMAIDQKNSKAIDERSAGLGRSLLHEACAYGHRPLVICLVEEFDADIHKRTLLGRDTPIHLAARHLLLADL